MIESLDVVVSADTRDRTDYRGNQIFVALPQLTMMKGGKFIGNGPLLDARVAPLHFPAPPVSFRQACRVILTSVPKSMRAILFDGKDAPFERKDPRLRPVPFAVGKPVFEEVIAVHGRVTSIVFTPSVPDLSNRLGEDSSGEAVKGTDAVTGVPRQGKKESGRAEDEHRQGEKERSGGGGPSSFGEVESCPPSRELIVACERGDAEAAAALLDRLAVSGGDPDGSEADGARVLSTAGAEEDALEEARGNWTAAEVINRPDGLERVMTPLHVAAAEGHSPVIEVLLERGASPLAEDVRGRLPYMMAQKKDARDAFRRARAAQPDRWDWDAARVPEPLTDVRDPSESCHFHVSFRPV